MTTNKNHGSEMIKSYQREAVPPQFLEGTVHPYKTTQPTLQMPGDRKVPDKIPDSDQGQNLYVWDPGYSDCLFFLVP